MKERRFSAPPAEAVADGTFPDDSGRKNPRPLEEVLREQGFLICGIRGDSMMPFLKEGKDAVRLEPLSRPLRAGDMALYRRPDGQLVLHRVTAVRPGRKNCTTCGDNRTQAEKVPLKDVFGIAAGFYTSRSAVWSGPDSGLQEASGERIYISASDPAYLQAVRAVLAERKKHAELYDRPLPKNVWDPLLRLLRKALTGEDVSFAEDADWEGVFLVARDQGIAALLYSALPDSGPSADLLEKWKRAYASAIRKDLLFARMWEGLKRDLAEAEISFLPLKGMVLRDLYPVPGMREFSDYDLLYDPLKGDALEEIMNARGFRTVSREGVHDVYQKDPVYNFEFHKELFSDACPWRKAFESERVWETAVPEDGSAFRMPGPVFYAYFIAHTWKHFESAGCGLRPFADLFLLQTKTGFLSDADRELGSELLDRTGLRNAERILLDQTDVLFRKNLLDVSYPQVRYCLESGVNGTVSNALRNRISDSGKAGYLLGRLFLPYRQMCELYPVLRTCPVLLPFCWVARWTGCLFRKEKRARAASELRILREKPQEWEKENE